MPSWFARKRHACSNQSSIQGPTVPSSAYAVYGSGAPMSTCTGNIYCKGAFHAFHCVDHGDCLINGNKHVKAGMMEKCRRRRGPTNSPLGTPNYTVVGLLPAKHRTRNPGSLHRAFPPLRCSRGSIISGLFQMFPVVMQIKAPAELPDHDLLGVNAIPPHIRANFDTLNQINNDLRKRYSFATDTGTCRLPKPLAHAAAGAVPSASLQNMKPPPGT